LSSLNFKQTTIPGAWVIEPSTREDHRGRFFRAWCSKEFAENGINFLPLQANMGFSHLKGTIRGIHYQTSPALEAKLVRCTSGTMFDLVLDLRKDSSSYGKWFGVELSATNGRMLYLPEHCGHGYQTLEDNTEMHYMTSQFFTPSAARGVRFDDPVFRIDWPLPATAISDQDRNWPLVIA
jgi:dTDP-4-dehydrorhamnose 3,5-epimerase